MPTPLPRRKLLLFRSLALLLAPALLIAVELGLRLLPSPAPDPYVHLSPFSLFSRTEVAGEPHLRISHAHAYPDREISFPVAKPPGSLRIFALGASAAAGWPQPPEEAFSDYLEAMLRQQLDQSVAVINAAAHGFSSYRVRHVFDQVVELEPDAIVIFSGNNELLEKRTYGARAPALILQLAHRLRLVDFLNRHALERRTRLSGDELNEVSAALWEKVQRQATALRSDPRAFARVQEHYAYSLEAMVRRGEQEGVPVFLLTVPSNLRDWLPTVSHNSLDAELRPRWEDLYRSGRRALLEGEAAAAAAALDGAIALEPEHAESWFWRARAAEALGAPDAALAAYLRAKDLDYNPFRAHSAFNDAVRALAEASQGAWLVDLEREFLAAALGPAPGFDLFLDYVHPTRAGNLLAAESVYRSLAESEALGIRLAPAPPPLPSRPYLAAGDFALQMRLFGLATMNHQHATALDHARHLDHLVTGRAPACPVSTPPPRALPAAARQALDLFPRFLSLEERSLRGLPVDPSEREQALAAFAHFYETWYQHLRE